MRPTFLVRLAASSIGTALVNSPTAAQASPFADFIDGLPSDVTTGAAKLAKLGAGPVTGWALAAATRDFVTSTGAAGVGEEHRTSVLMGYLATSLGMFHRLGQISHL